MSLMEILIFLFSHSPPSRAWNWKRFVVSADGSKSTVAASVADPPVAAFRS